MAKHENAVDRIEIYRTAYPAIDSYWALDIVGVGRSRLFGSEYRPKEKAEKMGRLMAEALGVPLQVGRTDWEGPPHGRKPERGLPTMTRRVRGILSCLASGSAASLWCVVSGYNLGISLLGAILWGLMVGILTWRWVYDGKT